jgi:hypothetical protein
MTMSIKIRVEYKSRVLKVFKKRDNVLTRTSCNMSQLAHWSFITKRNRVCYL